jgi:hypothetical protein
LPAKANPAIPKGSSQPAEIGIDLLRGGKFIPVTAAAEMVRAEVAVPAPGVMAAGEKEQFQPLGIPLQASEMELLNEPDCGLALTVKVPDCPAGMVTVEGDALKVTVDEPPPPEVQAGL